MNKIIGYIMFALALLAMVQSADSQSSKRTINIGYFEAGDYLLHKAIMGELRNHLENMSNQNNENIEIVFDPYGYRTAEWNQDLCRAMAGDLVRMKNLDMIIAAGPWVVEDLLEAGYDKPIIGICQSEPELNGLVDGNGRPAAKNLTLTYDPDKLESDLAALSYLFPKSKCGFVYFPSGDEFKAVAEKAKRIAERYEIEILPANRYSESGTYSYFISAERLKKEIDVLYLPPLWGLDLEMIREFFTQIHFDRIKTFVADGYILLEKGAVASNCNRPYRTLARIAAYKIDKIIGGTTPANLPTGYEETKTLCINPNEAKKVSAGFGRNIYNKAKLIPEIPDESAERNTLKQAMEQAVFENADIRAENLIYEQAVLEAKKAFSSFLPNITAQAGAATADNEIEAAFYNNTLNRKYFANIDVEQKLFSYPAIKAIHAAQKNREKKNIDLQKAEKDLKKTVAITFLSIIENEDKVNSLNDIVNRLREFHEMALTEYRLGIAKNDNSLLLKERLIKAQLELLNAKHELYVSRVILNRLWSRPADNKFVPDRTGFDSNAMVRLMRGFESFSGDARTQQRLDQFFIEYGINNSLTLESAELTIGLYRDLLAQNRGKLYPEISLHAGYSYGSEFDPELNERKDYWFLGGLVNIPLYLGGTRGKTNRILQSQLDEVLFRKDARRLELMGDIVSRVDKFFTYISTLPIYYDLRNLSRTNLKAESEKYGSKEISYIELMRLEENLAENEMDLIKNRYGFFKSYVELLNIIGKSYLPANSPEEKAVFDKIIEYINN